MSADWVFHSGRVFDGRRLHTVTTGLTMVGGQVVHDRLGQRITA